MSIDFNVGDKVVYPAHGVGIIKGVEERTVAGQEVNLYVIAFEKDKMLVRVPVKRAEKSGLRALNTEKVLSKVIAVLKGRAKPGRGMWSRRAQEYEIKINSGDILAIAEVVRDLHKNVDDPDRSYSERIIYESALERLANEFSAIRELTMDEASKAIESILKSRKVAANLDSSDDIIDDVIEAA